jgi:hypothetical protein
MVQQSVQQSRCQSAVIIENGGPVLEYIICSDDDRSLFVSLADNLEQQVCYGFIDRQVLLYSEIF